MMSSPVSFLIILPLIILFQQCEGKSDLSSYGSEFYLTFPRSVNGAKNLSFTIHTLKTTSVQFNIAAIDNGFNYTNTITAGKPAIVTIPIKYFVRSNYYFYRKLGLKITSLETEPISVVGWSEHNGRTFMSYLGLPCHTQPTKKYVYYGVSTLGHNNFWGYLLLVGCRDNTNVTVIPSQYANVTMLINPQESRSTEKTYVYGETNQFVLNAGQTIYLRQSYADVSGTKVISDAPLTVISGHTLSRIPVTVLDAEPIVTQVPPTITWGKEFLLSPHHNRDNGQFYKIIAHKNHTLVQRKCGKGAAVNTTLGSGQVYQFSTSHTTYCSIVSNKPIYIAQIGASTRFNGGSYGDPTLNSVPPINQYLHSIEFTTYLVTIITGMNVLIPNNQYANNQLILSGTLYNLTYNNIIYYPNGSIAGYGVTISGTGTHTVTHPNPLGKLFISVYGWTTYGGYCYSGGMGLNPISPALPYPEVSFISEQFTVTEGDSVIITLNRSVNIEDSVSVRVSVTPLQVDTAKIWEDYQSVSVIVNFGQKEVINTITIQTVDDTLVEPTEYFTIRLYAISEEVVLFPITESVVQIIDNDFIKLGFTNTSMTLQNSTEAAFELTTHHGDLQAGEHIRVLLQVENIAGSDKLDVSYFDFYNYSEWYIASINLIRLPFGLSFTNNTAVVRGKLSIVSTNVNATIDPSVTTVLYTQVPPVIGKKHVYCGKN